MPIPGSVLGLQTPVPVARAAALLYPSLGTLRPVTKSQASTGQWTHTFADSTNPVYMNLACRLAPLIEVRPQSQERQLNADERAEVHLQVNFASYIAVDVQTLLLWQVKIDGVVYQIKAVESDGNKLTTRMMVANVNQFEA